MPGLLRPRRTAPVRVPGGRRDALVVLLGSSSVATSVLRTVPGVVAGLLACLALSLVALAPRRSQPVVGWVSGALTGLFGSVAPGNGSPRSGERRRTARRALSPRALAWVCAAAAVVVLGVLVAGGPVPRVSAVLAWVAVVVLMARGAGRFLRRRGLDDQLRDPLTGLASREAISEALAVEGVAATAASDASDAGEEEWPGAADRVALLLADIDGFDEINVTLGREAGDAVLTEVGSRLQAVLRPPQLLARLGGDEFAVLLPGAGREPATRVAAALREALSEPVDATGVRLSVQATVGVATCALPRGRPEDLLRQADAAVHRAKATGGGIAVYDPEKDGVGPLPVRRVDELRSALEQGDVVVHLQPQVELATGRVVGCEALARWRHPHHGVLLPSAFLPLAARTGLLRPVADVVLDRALEACAAWWPRHPVVVGVNVTAADLLDPRLSDRITSCLKRHGLPGEALRIEITEEALVSDPEAAGALLEGWRRLGVSVALDDFGTGYSSLAYLRELPFDELKLDRVFGADLRRRATVTIVRHTVGMAHGLGLRVVAEGVEDAAAARTVAELGCDVGQGLAFGAAMPLPEFLAMLEETAA